MRTITKDLLLITKVGIPMIRVLGSFRCLIGASVGFVLLDYWIRVRKRLVLVEGKGLEVSPCVQRAAVSVEGCTEQCCGDDVLGD